MATIGALVSDMGDMKALLASKSAAEGDQASLRALQKKMAASLASKIAKLPALSPGDAKHLFDATQACGQDKGGQVVICAAIDAKLGVALDGEDDKPASTNHQLLTNATSWATEKLEQTLRSRATIDVKLTVTAEYLANTLGCT